MTYLRIIYNPTTMKHILSRHERERLDGLIADAEARTGAQFVLAAVRRCDVYPELPWMASALGASLAGLVFLAVYLATPSWLSPVVVLAALFAMLAGGALFYLLALLEPRLARFLLSTRRARSEARQYAESLFLSRELFATGNRSGILLMVSIFERQIVLLPDTGARDRLNEETMQDVIRPMTTLLRQNKVGQAMEEGLKQLAQILEPAGPGHVASEGQQELPNTIIEEEGV